MRLTDVVKNLLIINVLLYVALNFTFLGNFFEYYELRRYWGGSIGIMHIFGNMLTLCFFGPMLERLWGPKRFLFFYLACGLGAGLLHLLVNTNSHALGASGAIAGVLLAFAYYNPSARIMLLFPPIPIKAKYLVGGVLLFDLFAGLTGMRTGIAHFAHLGGALIGALLVFSFNKNPNFLR